MIGTQISLLFAKQWCSHGRKPFVGIARVCACVQVCIRVCVGMSPPVYSVDFNPYLLVQEM